MLKRHAMRFAEDPDERDELILLTWRESERLGPRSSMALLVHFMKLMGKERKHSFLGAIMSGKSMWDAMNRGVEYFSKRVAEGLTLEDQLFTCEADPHGILLVKEFEASLTGSEEAVAGDIVAGYTEGESLKRLGLQKKDYRRAKEHLRRKAIFHMI